MATKLTAEENKNAGKTMLVIVLVLLVIFIIGIGVSNIGLPEGTVRITNTFVDINGDGLVDLIKIADVVLNTGSNVGFP